MTALNKVGSQSFKAEFRRVARRFLEKNVNCLFSTVASRSLIAQEISCFCPSIVIGGVEVAPFKLFHQLLDGLLDKRWTRRSEVEACKAEYQSFVQEQLQEPP